MKLLKLLSKVCFIYTIRNQMCKYYTFSTLSPINSIWKNIMNVIIINLFIFLTHGGSDYQKGMSVPIKIQKLFKHYYWNIYVL